MGGRRILALFHIFPWEVSMRLFRFVAGLLLAGVMMAAMAAPLVPQGARVAILGDSITEQKMYTQYIELYLVACNPQLGARVMQFGWSGDRAPGMANRVANDLLPFKPTFATTLYGMNDGSYQAYNDNIGNAYRGGMLSIITQLKKAGCTVLVGTPGAVDSKTYRGGGDTAKIYNDNLAKLGEIDKVLAGENTMPFVNVHDVLMDTQAKAKAALGDDYAVYGGDGVHPGANGQLVMAYAFLKGMGFDGDLGTVTVDMKGESTAANGHKVLSAKDGVVEVESSRYPFCVPGDDNAKNPNSARSILPYLPFQQDLNRFTLVVKNLGAEQGKVTWGGQSKVYTRADLEKGVNLAADFANNPFVPAFNKVVNAVAQKQWYETTLVKQLLTQQPGYLANLRNFLPKDAPEVATLTATYESINKQLWAREEKQMDDVIAAVVPVKHTITISTNVE
jgi:lysophospholipase L1-like esterase